MYSWRVWVLAHAELGAAVFHYLFSLVPPVVVFHLTSRPQYPILFANVSEDASSSERVASYGRNQEEYPMPEKPQKPEKPSQGQTLSLRISDALFARLERAKQLLSSKKGDSVSTSEVAKQLLESAREDRFEVADLMAKPTETLLEIRRKGEAQHILSRAEWILLSHFVQKGLEAYAERTPNPVSNESLIAVLDAFVAVYELRTERASLRDPYYMSNLPSECRPPKAKGADDSERVTAETVRRTVAETRKRLSDSAVKSDTFLAGRNLLILLEDEKLPAADAVNRALRPFFPVLWRLAARGHYCLTQESLRASPRARILSISRRFRPSKKATSRSRLIGERATIFICS